MIVTRDTRAPLPRERLAEWYAKAALLGLLRGNAIRFPAGRPVL